MPDACVEAVTFARCRSLLVCGAVIAVLAPASGPTVASTPQSWAELDTRSAAECLRLAGLADAKVGAPMRFGDDLGVDVRVVTGTVPNAPHDAEPVAMLCAFQRSGGRVEVIDVPAAAVLTALPTAPEIRGITWRAEDIGGEGIIDRSRATLVLHPDGSVSGFASCNAYSGRYTLDDGVLTLGELSLASEKSCAPSLMNQEQRFVAVLGGVRRVELLPTGALLVSGPHRQSLRFFPETSR